MRSNWDPESPLLLPVIVCYADILGFGKLSACALESGLGNEFLRQIKHSIAMAYEKVSDFIENVGVDPPILEMKAFTDNIVVAHPIRDLPQDYGEPELGTLLTLFADVQASLAASGFFLRGAITAGGHYQDEGIVYGDALLEAVKLDEPGAPPRLVIGLSVERLILKHFTFYHGWTPPHYFHLLQDPYDDKLFVNYLAPAYEFFPDYINHSLLEAHGRAVSNNLLKYKSDPNILRKYTWLATYHNYVCDTFANLAQSWGGLEANPMDMAARANAWRMRDYLIDFEAPPEIQPPQPLDEEGLRKRVEAAGMSSL